jgi:hypothetical protein
MIGTALKIEKEERTNDTSDPRYGFGSPKQILRLLLVSSNLDECPTTSRKVKTVAKTANDARGQSFWMLSRVIKGHRTSNDLTHQFFFAGALQLYF